MGASCKKGGWCGKKGCGSFGTGPIVQAAATGDPTTEGSAIPKEEVIPPEAGSTKATDPEGVGKGAVGPPIAYRAGRGRN